MHHRRSINVFSKGSYKLENEPEQLYPKFPKPMKQIDQYIQKEDELCLKAKRLFLKNMHCSSHFTHTHHSKGSTFRELESTSSSGRPRRHKPPGDFYLPGMPVELMSVNLKSKKMKKRRIKKLKKATKTGENGDSSEEEKDKKKGSDSESGQEEINSNTSGEEAGDYADTYFDNGEDYLPSDNSEGEGDFY